MFDLLLDPPWPPGKPTVKDVAKTSCFLNWTKPEHDGGAKIDSYVIEMLKSGTTDWIRVAENISLLEFFLKGLMEKQEYSFRVKAVNVAGESEPSEPSDPVLCKERLSKKPVTQNKKTLFMLHFGVSGLMRKSTKTNRFCI